MNRVLHVLLPLRPAGFCRLPACLVVVAAGVASACGSESATSIVAPTEQKCQVSVSQFTQSFNASGGTGQATISAARECSWSAASQASWIALATPAAGTGSATLRFNVAANRVAQTRSGALAVNDQQLRVSQEAAPCRFTVVPGGRELPAQGGASSFSVSTLTGCSWTASTTAGWVHLASNGGSGEAALDFSVEPNPAGARTAAIQVAGQTVSVTQAAALVSPPVPEPRPGPTPAPDPTPVPVSLSGKIAGLTGDCPALRFSIRGTEIVTDASTAFASSCGSLKRGTEVDVDGLRQADGTVVAIRVNAKKD